MGVGGRKGSSPGPSPPFFEMSAVQEQLHDRLLPIVLGLFRAGKLTGAFQHTCLGGGPGLSK